MTVVVLNIHFRFLKLGLFQYMRDCGGAKRSLPVPADPPDGPVGEEGLRPHPPPPPHHEAPTVSARQRNVRK